MFSGKAWNTHTHSNTQCTYYIYTARRNHTLLHGQSRKCTYKEAHMHASLINTYAQNWSSPSTCDSEREWELECLFAFEMNNITLNWQRIQSSPSHSLSLSADVPYWRISSPAWHSCCSESWRWLQQHVPLGTEPHRLRSQATGPSWGSQFWDQLHHSRLRSCSEISEIACSKPERFLITTIAWTESCIFWYYRTVENSIYPLHSRYKFLLTSSYMPLFWILKQIFWDFLWYHRSVVNMVL